MIVNNSLLWIMISGPQINLDNTLLEKHYPKPIVEHDTKKSIEPHQESTLEYNYITTEKFIEQSILKYQDILQ